jgi:hypothetical protein
LIGARLTVSRDAGVDSDAPVALDYTKSMAKSDVKSGSVIGDF